MYVWFFVRACAIVYTSALTGGTTHPPLLPHTAPPHTHTFRRLRPLFPFRWIGQSTTHV